TKANLELMLVENSQLRQQFGKVLEQLGELEGLAPVERRKKFREMEKEGILKFNGVDIRLFAHHTATNKPLPPPDFLVRTRRRLRNTNTLIEEFLKRELFKEGSDLKDEIDALTYNIVNANNPPEVREFKQKVEMLRESPAFNHYMDAKKEFIKKDPDLKTDADIIATKESVEEGVENLKRREDDLKNLSQAMAAGSISADEAQLQLEELALTDVK
ncbi:MAG TPA: hypothetical protein VF678_15715, partial [bacterium]